MKYILGSIYAKFDFEACHESQVNKNLKLKNQSANKQPIILYSIFLFMKF